MDLCIDTRERERGVEIKEYFTDKEDYSLDNITIEQLAIGDYIFSNNHGECCFEYKTMNDFFDSLSDNRVFNQAINQYNSYIHQFIIIEGTIDEMKKVVNERYKINKYITRSKSNTLSQKSFYGAIASLNCISTVFVGENRKVCMQYMYTQASKLLNDKVLMKRFNKTEGNPAFRFLSYCVDGVGEVTSKNIVQSCGLYSLNDVLNISRDDLLKVKGVGGKTADLILESIC